MKIIQLTDLHLGREGEDTRGIDVRANFVKALKIIQNYQPDCLVISGDICYRAPELPIYEWFFEHLKDYPIPSEVIPGNHDDIGMMRQVLDIERDIKGEKLYFSRIIDGEPILFLDTAPATMDIVQLDWLREQLKNNPKDLLIFMHHPPLLCGVPYMDNNHSFKTRKEIREIFFEHPYNLTIFTGHYHVEKTIRTKNLEINITPSTFFQINQEMVDFAVDHRRPGFRVIEKKGAISGHYVVYFD